MKTLFQSKLVRKVITLFLGLTAGAGAVAGQLRVPADHPTIQAAVDAAGIDDTIHIAPGIHTGQVQIISKRLTLIGQPGAILRATGELPVPDGPGEISFPILYIRSSEVTVRGLVFEGERLAGLYEGPGELRGLLLRGSSATVEHCSFYGFREGTPGNNEDGFALTASAPLEGLVNVRVSHCTFADNLLSILLIGYPGSRGLNFVIENNTIIGLGPIDTGSPPVGIVVREGVGGRIVGNTISGYSYTGTAADIPIAFGIEASHQASYPEFGTLEHLEIAGNSLRDNQVHVSLVKGDGSVVKNNRVQGSAPGIVPVGLAVSGAGLLLANNQFEDMPEAIRLFGDDPLFGEVVGVAESASVTSNRFCNVSVPINRQRLATAIETGTSTNACSSPLLVIRSASLISWPGEEGVWTVESAPSVDGPWTALDATPFLQHGAYNVAVPNEDARRFFRLR
ncbi:MAG: nitrous oxide reductase family maturation protein NosD [Limisphaerales bacterium]